ncbi:response regulator transcription factor [Laceyella putida]|uniref:Response regulator n=1 Tax=Laceyella putida TaxID=110101 RepID=A0ABW2RH01_9BACL
MRLLLVDDQELIRESLSIVLNMEPDIEVVGLAENGEIAVELCASEQPDVVLMDIHMPVMNGVEATKRIKQQWPHIRVIILTTFQEVQYVVDALSIGAEGYLLKAIHPKDLAAGIRLVWKGETLIPQDIAKLLVSQINMNSLTPETNIPKKERTKFGLTEREVEVLQCLADGLHNKEIAEKLFLSEGTVKNYISSIYSKLDVHDRLKAAKKAQEKGVL